MGDNSQSYLLISFYLKKTTFQYSNIQNPHNASPVKDNNNVHFMWKKLINYLIIALVKKIIMWNFVCENIQVSRTKKVSETIELINISITD
jgi:uncharacterized membrane protein